MLRDQPPNGGSCRDYLRTGFARGDCQSLRGCGKGRLTGHPHPSLRGSDRIDGRLATNVMSGMKAAYVKILVSFAILTALGLYVSARVTALPHYTADDLIGLNCEDIAEKHEEVITAFHDAAIAHHARTGAFPDGFGLPPTQGLPFVVLITTFIQDNGLGGFDFAKPHALSTSGPEAGLFAEVSNKCAANPSLDAMQAVALAAKERGLVE